MSVVQMKTRMKIVPKTGETWSVFSIWCLLGFSAAVLRGSSL